MLLGYSFNVRSGVETMQGVVRPVFLWKREEKIKGLKMYIFKSNA